MKKLLIFALIALMISACLTACGGDPKPADPVDTVDTQDTEPAGTDTEEQALSLTLTLAGDWTVAVPEGFELQIGDFFDENDTRYFSVKKSSFSTFDFSADGEESIMRNYEYNKNTYTNEQVDFKETYGENEWTGFQYSDGWGGYGFEAYATIGGQLIRVASVGFRYDSEIARVVLDSVKYTPGE